MSRRGSNFQQAGSLFRILKHCRYEDCLPFFQYLDDRGTEIFCELLHFIVKGDLEIPPAARAKIKKRLKGHAKEFKRLITPPRGARDIRAKKRILQKRGVIDILANIAAAVFPIVNRLLFGDRH